MLGRTPPLSARAASSLRALWAFAKRNPPAMFSSVVLIVVVLAAVAAPALATFDPLDPIGRRLQPPNATHWLGTDQLGRDVWSRVVFGARITLYVSLLAVAISVVLGFTWGLTAGYFGGIWDLGSARVMDALGAFPTIVLALAFMSALGASLNNVVITLVVVFTPQMARILRASALGISRTQFIEAARSVGASHSRILRRHIAPNAVSTLVVLFSANLGTAAILEASLSFLGVGADPHAPSWGGMLTRGASTLVLAAPWIAIAPGLALVLTVMSFNLIGDAIRDELDPRLRGR